MAQAKKKQATKTAKKTVARKTAQKSTCAHSKSARCTKKCDNRERNHIYIITAMSMIVAILLCVNVVLMII